MSALINRLLAALLAVALVGALFWAGNQISATRQTVDENDRQAARSMNNLLPGPDPRAVMGPGGEAEQAGEPESEYDGVTVGDSEYATVPATESAPEPMVPPVSDLPRHAVSLADSQGISQIRAVIKEYPKPERDWQNAAVALCAGKAANRFLVAFFDDDCALEGWDGAAGMREPDRAHWLCSVAVENGQPMIFQIARDVETGASRAGVVAAVDESGVQVPAGTVDSESIEGPEAASAPPVAKPLESPDDDFRTWTNSTGAHTLEAEFGGLAFGKVTLRTRDGTKTVVPLEKLSDEDRQWIEERKR